MLKLIWIVIAYLIGSIPWALIVGKVFFNKDIRNYGSGNLGGSNASRVLGKPYGILVILLDASKAFVVMAFANHHVPSIIQYIGLFVCIGHCFPIFADFRGGKAVASACGYVLGLSVFVTHEYLLTFIVPMIVFFLTVVISKYISLGSMLAVLSTSITQLILGNEELFIILFALAVFVADRHKANIERILNGTENKITKKKN